MSADLSLAAAVAFRAAHAPDDVAVVDDVGATLTFAELARGAAGLGTTLRAAGVTAGDRVAWAGRNHPGLLLTLLAAQHLGAVFVPLSFRASPAEAAETVYRCGARVVVALPAATHQLTDLSPAVTTLVWDQELVAAPPAERRKAEADDLAVLMNSSGTSGPPKAVMLSHGNLWWSARNLEAVVGLERTDVTLAVAPMFHIGGLNCFAMGTLARGGTVLVRETFDPARTLADLTSRVTTVFGVPSMYEAIARLPEFAAADLSGVRAAVVGGAPVPRRLLDACQSRGLALLPSWGMTETAPAATLLPRDLVGRKSCSVGPPLPYIDMQLHDPDTGERQTTPGACGEIWVSGPQVTAGYWRDEAATAAALHDGWFRTGDIGAFDDDGYLGLVGRLSEVVNSGGEKISPAEVESALAPLMEDGRCELVVVGVPDTTWGEVLVAVVQPGAGDVPGLEDVRTVAAASVARFKLPKHLVVTESLPRTASGKVNRRAVRALATDRVSVAPTV